MSIYRYTASLDNTITNAYASNLKTRGTGSNMGASDILEVFSIYGQSSSTSVEKSRFLIKFDMTPISSDRASGKLPGAGGVKFFLKLANAKHSSTLPSNFTLNAYRVTSEWEEGSGLDMEEYTDLGYCNWKSTKKIGGTETLWSTEGGDFDLASVKQAFFDKGTEDLKIDITDYVESWIDGTNENHGVIIKLKDDQEDGSLGRSFYTKKFFSRTSEYFFKRPVLEAQWNSSVKNNILNFKRKNNLAPDADNLNKIFLFNTIRGKLVNIPSIGEGNIFLSVYDSEGNIISLPQGGGVASDDDTVVTGNFESTGIYSANFSFTSSESSFVPVWSNSTTQLFTGSTIEVEDHTPYSDSYYEEYFLNIDNLKSAYSRNETARFNLFVRKKNWSPTIYSKASEQLKSDIVDNIYFKLNRVIDNYEVIGYGTGSEQETLLSYGASGSYFHIEMDMLQQDYLYELSFLFLIDGDYREQEQKFKFRVE